MRSGGLTALAILCLSSAGAVAADAPTGAWRAGLAKADITPTRSMWLAGYASRSAPSTGVEQPLFAKALAMEDALGHRLVIVTCDLIGIPRELGDRVAVAAAMRHRLPRESLLLNASHTHCGPELRPEKVVVYGAPDEYAAVAAVYAARLEATLIDLIGLALDDLRPAALAYTHARCGFAMNRRRPTEDGIKNSPHADGEVDHDVPVLVVSSDDGSLRGLLFGYACHNTTLSFQRLCGDYAGHAQAYLEEAHAGVTALFMAGCGGDQNPYPRRTLDLARQHGRALANAVEAALETRPRAIAGQLRSRYGEVTLDFDAPTVEEFRLRLSSPVENERRHAERLLAEYERTGVVRQTYDYPIQVAHVGDGLVLVALAGEAVVGYSLRLKRELAGPDVWVAGYSNDVFGYVPTLRVLREGGYEGGDAMLGTLLPGPFAPTVEERIIAKARELAK